LSSGVKLTAEPVPDAKALPFLVTSQARVKPALVSAVLGSVAEPVRLMGVPSRLDAGEALRPAVGDELFSVNVVVGEVD
jgi:hypothetical protein